MLSLQNQILWFKRLQWSLAAATLLLACGFYFLIYAPRIQRLKDVQATMSRSQNELIGTQSKTRVLPSVEAEVNRLRERVSKFKTLPRQDEIGGFLLEMEQLARQASLKSLVIRDSVSSNAGRLGGKLNEKALDLAFEGDFVSIYSFLRRSEDMQRLTRIPSMTIKARDRDGQGQVKVSMKMNLYFQAE